MMTASNLRLASRSLPRETSPQTWTSTDTFLQRIAQHGEQSRVLQDKNGVQIHGDLDTTRNIRSDESNLGTGLEVPAITLFMATASAIFRMQFPRFWWILKPIREIGLMTETAYLSLGSNLGDRAANLREAIAQLDVTAGRLIAISKMYETQPVDVPDQPWFLNCMAALETDKTPRELLELALQTEAAMGRLRMRDKGARKIDIDIVLFGDRIVDEPGLKIRIPPCINGGLFWNPWSKLCRRCDIPNLGKR